MDNLFSKISFFIRTARIKVSSRSLEVVFLLLLGLIVLNWFRDDLYIKSVDSFFGYNPQYEAYVSNYIWKHATGTGYLWGDMNTQPYYYFWAWLNKAGLSLVDSQKIMFWLLFSFSMVSMYYLSAFFFHSNSTSSRVARIATSMFYAMNPFALSLVWWHQMWIQFTWILFPAITGVFLRILSEDEKHYWALVLFGICLFWILAPGASLVYLVVLFFLLVFLAISTAVLTKETKRIAMKTALTFLIWFVSNLWFLIPYSLSLQTFYQGAFFSTNISSEAIEALTYSSQYSTLLNVFRLQGSHIIYGSFYADRFYEWADTFVSNPLFIAISFLPILLVAGALLNRNSISRLIPFTLLLPAILFVMKGSAEPFSFVNISFIYLPFGGGFRHPYLIFGVVLVIIFSLMIGQTLDSLWSFTSRLCRRILRYAAKIGIAILVFSLFVIYMYPFFIGDVISDGGCYLASERNQIPEYYMLLGANLTEDPQICKIATLPLNSETAYIWGNTSVQPNMDPILQYFLPNKSVVMTTTGNAYADRVVNGLKNAFDNPTPSSFLQLGHLLRLWNFKYLVVHDDWHPYYTIFGIHTPEWYKILLGSLTLNVSPSLNFNDDNSYAEIMNSTNIEFEREFIISTLVKPAYTSGDSTIIGQGTWMLQWQTTSSGGYFGLYLADVKNGWITSPILPSGLWYHVVGLFDRSKIQLFVNNVKVAEQNASGTLPISSDNIFVGRCAWPNEYFKGEIAQLSIYNKPLDVEQVSQLLENKGIVPTPCVQVSSSNLACSSLSLHQVTWSKQNAQKASIEPPVRYGNLTVFSVPDTYPLIYATSNLVLIPEEFNVTNLFETVVPAQNYSFFVTAYSGDFKDSMKPPSFCPLANESEPMISCNMVSPTSYSVKVLSGTQPFYLVFQESYDKEWTATIAGEKLEDPVHFVSNGFGNCWFINRTGSFEINLEYGFQQVTVYSKYFSVGAFFAVFTIFLVCNKRFKKLLTPLGAKTWQNV